eukprot:87187-Chlamydomonas_euryale.AAC.2
MGRKLPQRLSTQARRLSTQARRLGMCQQPREGLSGAIKRGEGKEGRGPSSTHQSITLPARAAFRPSACPSPFYPPI